MLRLEKLSNRVRRNAPRSRARARGHELATRRYHVGSPAKHPKSRAATETAAVLYTRVETAKLHDVDPSSRGNPTRTDRSCPFLAATRVRACSPTRSCVVGKITCRSTGAVLTREVAVALVSAVPDQEYLMVGR